MYGTEKTAVETLDSFKPPYSKANVVMTGYALASLALSERWRNLKGGGASLPKAEMGPIQTATN